MAAALAAFSAALASLSAALASLDRAVAEGWADAGVPTVGAAVGTSTSIDLAVPPTSADANGAGASTDGATGGIDSDPADSAPLTDETAGAGAAPSAASSRLRFTGFGSGSATAITSVGTAAAVVVSVPAGSATAIAAAVLASMIAVTGCSTTRCGLGGDSPPFLSLSRRFCRRMAELYRFLIALSVRPGMSLTILDQRVP